MTEQALAHRIASPQAWCRLRKALTDNELRDIAEDIRNVLDDERSLGTGVADNIVADSIYHALAAKNWESLKQG